jgi:cell division protein FtsW (lipid II flippase)
MIKKRPASPFSAPSRWEGLVAASLGTIVYVASLVWWDPGPGTIAGGFMTSLAICIRICWPLVKQLWFWLTMLVLILLHLFTIFGFSWEFAKDWTGLTLIPFMAIDVLFILFVVFFAFCAMYGRPAHLIDPANGE